MNLHHTQSIPQHQRTSLPDPSRPDPSLLDPSFPNAQGLHNSARQWVTATFGLLATVAIALVALMATSTSSAAHSQLISSTPSDTESLDTAPANISLLFNEDLLDLGQQIVLEGADGVEIPTDEGTVDGPNFSTEILEELTAGDYTVTWRVVSADGHPISGTFTFTVTAAAHPTESASYPAAPTEAAPNSTVDPTTADPSPVDGDTEPPTPDSDVAPSADDEAADSESADADSAFPWMTVGVVAALIVTAAVVVLIIRRRQTSTTTADADSPGPQA